MRGRTISIYLPDGNPRGVKICDIQDSIVKAFYIPRAKLQDIYGREELNDPGIYFLFGEPDEVGKSELYIGEAENILGRIKQHNTNKDFWNVCICFLSEKKNLNKAHVKYLESFCCDKALSANKTRLQNSNTPSKSSLTDQDRDFVLNYFDDLKILLSALGFPVFDEAKKDKKNVWYCKGKDAVAIGKYSEEGLTVFKESKANLNESPTAGSWVTGMREKLKEKGILKQKDKVLMFTEDYTFNSPSAAAAVVLARRSNGWMEWKDKDKITMDEQLRKK